MYKINFDRPQNIHFIGIGGISMSGLAEVLLDEGFTVSGSDSADSELLQRLRFGRLRAPASLRIQRRACGHRSGG